MCELFIGANSELWASKTRSLRIDGVATSVRMENFFGACSRRLQRVTT